MLVFLIVVHGQGNSVIHAIVWALAHADVLPNTNFDALIRQRAGERGRFFHSWELLGGVDVEGGREDGLAMPHVVPDDFEQAQLQPVAALCTHAQIRKHEETSIFIVVLRVLQVVKR